MGLHTPKEVVLAPENGGWTKDIGSDQQQRTRIQWYREPCVVDTQSRSPESQFRSQPLDGCMKRFYLKSEAECGTL